MPRAVFQHKNPYTSAASVVFGSAPLLPASVTPSDSDTAANAIATVRALKAKLVDMI